MDFDLTPEQLQFKDALTRWIAKDYSFDHRKQVIRSMDGTSSEDWNVMAGLGLMALVVPSYAGGFDGTSVDMMIAMQEIGHGLVIEPYLPTIMGAQFLIHTNSQPELLTAVAEGRIKISCALAERESRYDLFDVCSNAVQTNDGFVISGEKTVVVHGDSADKIIVSARTSGSRRDASGLTLFVVDSSCPGLSTRSYRTIDGGRAADMTFENVHVASTDMLGVFNDAWPVIDRVADYATAALCAEALGLMESINLATIEHLKARKQFGAALGSFQVLQHRMVEMYMELEQARSLVILAAVRCDATDDASRRRAVSSAKVRVGNALKFIGQNAVHLHGGIGVTDELSLAHYFKRGTVIERTMGDVDFHLERLVMEPDFTSDIS